MKSVDCVWEKRNLGVDAVEITVERGDDPDEVIREIGPLEKEYSVVKVPVNTKQIPAKLQDAGYYYIETMISLRRSTLVPELSANEERLIKEAGNRPMEEADYEHLKSQVMKDMFDTGRISLDSAFTQEQANKRYAGWICDEIERGTPFYTLTYKDEPAGFFALKEVRKGVVLPFLAGIYPEGPKALGLGFALTYEEIKCAGSIGARTITGSVSSNNVASLASLTSFGYTIDGAVQVFVKHSGK